VASVDKLLTIFVSPVLSNEVGIASPAITIFKSPYCFTASNGSTTFLPCSVKTVLPETGVTVKSQELPPYAARLPV